MIGCRRFWSNLTQGWDVYCFCRRQIQFTNTRAVDIPEWELGKPDACVVMGWAAECRKPLFEQKSRGMRSLKTPRLSAPATLGARRLNSRPKFPFKNTRRHWRRSCQPTIQRETMDYSKQQIRCLTCKFRIPNKPDKELIFSFFDNFMWYSGPQFRHFL